MKVGLVLEGGAMRGLYTAGVIDTFLKEKTCNMLLSSYWPWH